jgi:hypothetical protein
MKPSDRREFWGKIPVINLIVDTLDNDPPPFDGVIAALNAMGLLSALCLTVAMSFPGSVSYEVPPGSRTCPAEEDVTRA